MTGALIGLSLLMFVLAPYYFVLAGIAAMCAYEYIEVLQPQGLAVFWVWFGLGWLWSLCKMSLGGPFIWQHESQGGYSDADMSVVKPTDLAGNSPEERLTIDPIEFCFDISTASDVRDAKMRMLQAMITILDVYRVQLDSDLLIEALASDCALIVASQAAELGGLTIDHSKVLCELMNAPLQADAILSQLRRTAPIPLYGQDFELKSFMSALCAKRDGRFDVCPAMSELFGELAWLTAVASDTEIRREKICRSFMHLSLSTMDATFFLEKWEPNGPANMARWFLGVGRNGTWDDVKLAHHGLVKQWHPDRYENESTENRAFATEQMTRINSAFQTLNSTMNH